MSEGWLKNTFVTCVDALVVSGGETAASQIAVAAETAVSGVAAGFVALVVFAVLGIAAGYMLTKFSVRRNMAKRGLWKFILAAAVDARVEFLSTENPSDCKVKPEPCGATSRSIKNTTPSSGIFSGILCSNT